MFCSSAFGFENDCSCQMVIFEFMKCDLCVVFKFIDSHFSSFSVSYCRSGNWNVFDLVSTCGEVI